MKNPRQQEWEINQDISDEEISKGISSDGISIGILQRFLNNNSNPIFLSLKSRAT